MLVSGKKKNRFERVRPGLWAAWAVTCLFLPQAAFAHRDDYINETVVYLTLAHNEREAEYWLDSGANSGTAQDFLRHNAALEWGITDHWMVDGRFTAIAPSGSGPVYDSSRVETRYRFSEEGVKPLDVAVSMEVNSERRADGSTGTGIEPRLILSHDFGEKFNVTGNLSEDVPLNSGSPTLLTALGLRYNWTRFVRVGSEFQYDVGDVSGAVIPQVWFAFSPDVTLKLGYAAGIDRNPIDFARAALEVEF
jgi:hypothetical protein